MDPSDETPDETPAEASAPARRRRLDGRTIGICACVALVAAIVAALLVGALTGSDDHKADATDGAMVLIDAREVARTPMLDLEGQETTLADHLGDGVTVVNLWASTCAPCIKELPLFEATSKANPDVAFLGVDVLDRLDNAKVMAEQSGITYPWVQDQNGDFGNAVRSTTLPATFLFDTDGTILASKTDKAFHSQAELEAWIDANS